MGAAAEWNSRAWVLVVEGVVNTVVEGEEGIVVGAVEEWDGCSSKVTGLVVGRACVLVAEEGEGCAGPFELAAEGC